MKNVLVITHSNYINDEYVRGPGDHIRNFLALNSIETDLISLGFSNCRINRFELNNSLLVKKTVNSPIKYIFDLFYIKKSYRVVIACDPLCFISVYFINIFRKVYIYLYILDYSKKRFHNSKILSYIYRKLVDFSTKNAYKIISASEKISEDLNLSEKVISFPNYPLDISHEYKVHEFKELKLAISFTELKNIDYKAIINVISKINRLNKNKKRITITFIGIVETEPKILEYAKEQNLLDFVKYCGVKDRKSYFSILNSCNIGIEINSGLQSYNEYRDPIKIREYIFHSMPIISKFGHAANDYIVKNGLGWVFTNEDELENILTSIDADEMLLVESNKAINKFYKFNPKILLKSILDLKSA